MEKHRMGPEGSLLDEVGSHGMSAVDVERYGVVQAFDGNVDDSCTRSAPFDASQAIMQSVEQTIASLEATNDHLQKRQLGREQELARQPDVDPSMRM